jgi:hypothetical protein
MSVEKIVAGWVMLVVIVFGIAVALVIHHEIREAKRAKTSASFSLVLEKPGSPPGFFLI